MKVKAKTSFSGDITMQPGEILDIDAERAERLIRIGHCEPCETDRTVKRNEGKRSNRSDS